MHLHIVAALVDGRVVDRLVRVRFFAGLAMQAGTARCAAARYACGIRIYGEEVVARPTMVGLVALDSSSPCRGSAAVMIGWTVSALLAVAISNVAGGAALVYAFFATSQDRPAVQTKRKGG